VWTLAARAGGAIGALWKTWRDLGVHVIEEGWTLPTGLTAFTESGTYAPTYLIGPWTDRAGETHLFFCDGYAASRDRSGGEPGPDAGPRGVAQRVHVEVRAPVRRRAHVMTLDPGAPDFDARLGALLGSAPDQATADDYRRMIHEGADAGVNLDKATLSVEDFFPEKAWDVLAISGYMQPDPYSARRRRGGVAGVYRVTVRLASMRGDKRITFTLRLMEPPAQARLAFSPLLSRFLGAPATRRGGQDLRLGAHPERAADAVRRGAGVHQRQPRAATLRQDPGGDHPAREAGDARSRAALVQEAPPGLVLVAGDVTTLVPGAWCLVPCAWWTDLVPKDEEQGT